MWNRVLALVRKELLALLRDRRSRFVIVAPPILQSLVFGYAATFELRDVHFAVYDQDRSAYSRELIADFAGSPQFVAAGTLLSDRDIPQLLDAGDVLLVLRIPPGFARDLDGGSEARLQLLLDGRNSNTALIAAGYARQIVERFVGRLQPGGSSAGITTRFWFNPNAESRWFIVPGIIGLLTLLVTMLVTSMSVAREREQGTFDQLLVTPLTPVDILLGKSLPGLLIGLAEATVMIGIVTLWFDVPLRGSLPALYGSLAVFLLSAIGVGLMISSLSVTQQQALLGAFLFMVPAILLSGFATPIRNMPEIVQWLTYANPLRYFMRILRGEFLEAMSPALLLHQLWPMLVIGAICLAFSAWLFRRRLA